MMTASEIPEALKAKARELFDTLPLMPTASKRWYLAQIEAFALQVRNEAIAEEREACAAVAHERMYDFGCMAGEDAADFAVLCGELEAAIRARP